MANNFISSDNRHSELENISFAFPVSSMDSNLCYNLNRTNANLQSNGTVTLEEHQEHKKKPSFQITSVTVQGARINNDPEEDSIEDFDELNSETFTCSKKMDVDNDQSSEDTTGDISSISTSTTNSNITELPFLSTSSIPIKCESVELTHFPKIGNSEITVTSTINSSRFAKRIVQPERNQQVLSLSPIGSSSDVTEVPMASSYQWQNRFKVVKLVSSEPFKRGRWICTDFTDPPVIQQEAIKNEMSTEQSNSSLKTTINGLTNIPNDHIDSNSSDISHMYLSQTHPVTASEGFSVTLDAQQNSQPIYSIILPVCDTTESTSVGVIQTLGIQTMKAVANDCSQQFPFSDTLEHIQVAPISKSVLSQDLVTPKLIQDFSENEMLVEVPQTQICELAEQEISNQLHQGSKNIIPNSCGSQNLDSQDQQTGYAFTNRNKVTSTVDTLGGMNTMYTGSSGSETAFSASAPLSEVLPEALGVIPVAEGEETESAPSGSSTVAIDNKIEQAMDLVKSHLMFAVREEVDVLKEKISELMEKISQLEYENGILKTHASQETLNKLSKGGLQSIPQTQLQQKSAAKVQVSSQSQHPS
ncbi:uncharacterized protein LOC143240733 [Tachypleus tridentatus]|uniref:uncharacterized protein LOC143240733 n=1 Tax=Tachypleus tridentatus TaxID=6853 RepID=UPI003FD40752